MQRHTLSTTHHSEGATAWGPPASEADLDLPDKEEAGYDEASGDSKAVKLTLMEEVLLMGLKDREVRCQVVPTDTARTGHQVLIILHSYTCTQHYQQL